LKRIENRPWRTHVRGPILIHAGLGKDTFDCVAMCKRLGVPLPDVSTLPRGGIVGVVDIVDCVTASDDPFFFGPFGFVLANARPLPFTPCRGFQRFFHAPADVVAKLGLAPLEKGGAS
jgi:hypothetical protein